MSTLNLEDGVWLNPPAHFEATASDLTATAKAGSDFWRDTYYDFRRDTGHALLFTLAPGRAFELTLRADLREQFDQAGLLVRRDAATWVKAGLELADGRVGIGAVVTRQLSDWSTWALPAGAGAPAVTLRASWTQQALIVRARLGDEPWRLLRVAPFHGQRPVLVGPYLCAPNSEEFSATFTHLRLDDADASLH